jgi:hypothetical protein
MSGNVAGKEEAKNIQRSSGEHLRERDHLED